MQEKNNLVEEALIQMKNVEQAIAENAKGILQSTMKEEISQLVKESLSEQDEEEMDFDSEIEMDDLDQDDSDEFDSMELDIDDESPIDLTDASDEEILKVFKSMGDEDGIIVKKDGEDIHLKDQDDEYIIKLDESYHDEEELDEVDDEDVSKIIDDIFSETYSEMDETDDMDEIMYEIEFDDEEFHDEEFDDEEDEFEIEFDDDEEEESDDEEDEFDDEEEEFDDEEYEGYVDESYNPKKVKKGEHKESKGSIKPKGLGIGKPKFSYKKSAGGFKEDKKEGPKSIGTGKPKFNFDTKAENVGGSNKVVKKSETKEAARTLGMGDKFREGGLPKPRSHSKFNANIKESLDTEVNVLREKNEEYRKALNVFREKLNEVAVFNSNLAYATRLFTEHSTTKKEKLNILRRFDNVETLRESKSLYKSIKDELNKTETKSISESVETKLNKSVSTGSATNLIESKTYENPQFLRMKDLMTKIG